MTIEDAEKLLQAALEKIARLEMEIARLRGRLTLLEKAEKPQ